jgi:hypothetical protein
MVKFPPDQSLLVEIFRERAKGMLALAKTRGADPSRLDKPSHEFLGGYVCFAFF